MVKKTTEERRKYFKQRYMTLAIPQERYEKMLPAWRGMVKPALPPDQSYTVWVTETLERTISKYGFLKKAFPDFRTIITGNDFLIENTKTNQVVKVFMKDSKIECNTKEGSESYVLFASMHPLFNVG